MQRQFSRWALSAFLSLAGPFGGGAAARACRGLQLKTKWSQAAVTPEKAAALLKTGNQ